MRGALPREGAQNVPATPPSSISRRKKSRIGRRNRGKTLQRRRWDVRAVPPLRCSFSPPNSAERAPACLLSRHRSSIRSAAGAEHPLLTINGTISRNVGRLSDPQGLPVTPGRSAGSSSCRRRARGLGGRKAEARFPLAAGRCPPSDLRPSPPDRGGGLALFWLEPVVSSSLDVH